MLTIEEKLEALYAAEAANRAAEDAVKKKYADLINPVTGEALKDGDPPIIDKNGRAFWVAAGRLRNGMPTRVGEKPAS